MSEVSAVATGGFQFKMQVACSAHFIVSKVCDMCHCGNMTKLPLEKETRSLHICVQCDENAWRELLKDFSAT